MESASSERTMSVHRMQMMSVMEQYTAASFTGCGASGNMQHSTTATSASALKTYDQGDTCLSNIHAYRWSSSNVCAHHVNRQASNTPLCVCCSSNSSDSGDCNFAMRRHGA